MLEGSMAVCMGSYCHQGRTTSCGGLTTHALSAYQIAVQLERTVFSYMFMIRLSPIVLCRGTGLFEPPAGREVHDGLSVHRLVCACGGCMSVRGEVLSIGS
jgi:hypothetical protein